MTDACTLADGCNASVCNRATVAGCTRSSERADVHDLTVAAEEVLRDCNRASVAGSTLPARRSGPPRSPRPSCCADYARHRRPLTSYHYRAANGWHCWECDGRRDDGWRYCRPVPVPVPT
jgi:hypothetical protein